jgi:hypothetical protein
MTDEKHPNERLDQVHEEVPPPVSESVYELAEGDDFEQFFQASPLRARVSKQLHYRMQRRMGLNWLPHSILSELGFGLHLDTREVMKRFWLRQLHSAAAKKENPQSESGG